MAGLRSASVKDSLAICSYFCWLEAFLKDPTAAPPPPVVPKTFPLFLGPGFRLGARWNRFGSAVKTHKKRGKTGGKWARYGLRSVKEEASLKDPTAAPPPPAVPKTAAAFQPEPLASFVLCLLAFRIAHKIVCKWLVWCLNY